MKNNIIVWSHSSCGYVTDTKNQSLSVSAGYRFETSRRDFSIAGKTQIDGQGFEERRFNGRYQIDRNWNVWAVQIETFFDPEAITMNSSP